MFSVTVKIQGNPDRNQGDWEETHTLSATNMEALQSFLSATSSGTTMSEEATGGTPNSERTVG